MPTRPERPYGPASRHSNLRAGSMLIALLVLVSGLFLFLRSTETITSAGTIAEDFIALVLAVAVGIVIGGVAGYLIIGRRVRALVIATRRVSEGDLAARTGPPYPPSQLGSLARALDEMAATLQERRNDAERSKAELEMSLEVLRATDEERKRLVVHLTQAQEQERGRIASDIHDDSIQAMTAVGIRLEALRRRMTEPEQLRVLEQLEETVVLSIARLRHLLFELRPPVLDREGLVPALRVYLDEMGRESGFAYEIDNRLMVEPSEDTRRILYRIIQEALTNVRKHAGARRVIVLLKEEERGFRVRVQDDGRGFSLMDRQDQEPGHLGFTAMRERAELAGGWWRVASAPGKGTIIEFWLPARETRPLQERVSR